MHPCILVAILLSAPALALAQAEDASFAAEMERAANAMETGRHAEAGQAYERALAAAQSDAERAHATWGLSRALEATGDRAAAMEALKYALELRPETPPAGDAAAGVAPWLASCLQHLAFLAERAHDDDLARQARVRLIEVIGADSPQASDALLGLARAERDAGEIDRAIQRLQEMLAADAHSGRHSQARGMLAQLLTEAGRHDEALTVARAASDPIRAQMLTLVAGSLMDAGEAAKAGEVAREVLDEVPNHPQAARLLYRSARQRDELPALRDELQAEAEERGSESAIRLLAQIATWQDDPASAVRWYRRLTQLHPDDPDLLVELGNAALEAGRHDVAEEALRAARELAPNHRGASLALGELLVRQDRTDEALELFKAAVEYDPRNVTSVRSLTQVLTRHSLHHAALETFEEARRIAEDDTLLAFETASTLKDLLRYEDAAREYLRAMEVREIPARSVGHQLERLVTDELAGEAVLGEIEAWADRTDPPAEARLTLARVLLTAGRNERAVELLEGVREAASEIAQLAREAQLRGDGELALQLYPLALSLDLTPDQAAEVALRMARLQHEKGAWRVALQTLESTRALHRRPEALLMRARILQYEARRLDEAREAWQQLLATAGEAPRYASAARRGLADWLFAMGKLDEAERAYAELLPGGRADDREHPRGLDLPPLPPGFSMPRDVFDEIIGAKPGDEDADPGWAMLRMAEISLRRGELDEARERFWAVTRDYPHSDRANDALQWLAFISENLRGERRTEQSFLQALGLRDRGETADAEMLLLEIAGTRGESLADDALLLLGELRADEDPRRAADTWLSMAERFPESLLIPAALMRAAQIMLDELDDVEGARDALRKIAEEHPDAAVAHQARSKLDLLPSPRS